MKRILSIFLALGLLALPLSASAAEEANAAQQQKQAKLLFVANTGLEDIGTLSSSLRHATGATKSDHVSEVVWMVYGRAIVAVDPTVSAVPQSVREQMAAAKKAGVRLVACAQALKKFGIDRAAVEKQGIEVAENAIDELGRLVADGYEAIRY